MGLLLGDTATNERGEIVTHIWKASPQIRKDRRKVCQAAMRGINVRRYQLYKIF